MHQDRFWELVSLKLSGEASPSELAELENFLQDHPAENSRFNLLATIWEARQENGTLRKKESFNKHLQRLSTHLAEPVLQYESVDPFPLNNDENSTIVNLPSRNYRKLAWVGGIAASVITIFLFFTLNREQPKNNIAKAQNTISTKRGSKSKIQLPDGTQVWLNADSRITYKENFQGELREVELTGEAFFDVVRDESRPFIIHTSTIDVKVLGTAFNVRSYANEKNTETSLIHGSIEVTLVKSADKRKITLKPNDKLIVTYDEAALEQKDKARPHSPLLTLGRINYRKKDSSALETLWVDNKLAFDEEPLEEIALKIERWYDVKVIIADEELKKEKFSGIFEDENLEQVLEALRFAGIKSSVNRKEVVLKQ